MTEKFPLVSFNYSIPRLTWYVFPMPKDSSPKLDFKEDCVVCQVIQNVNRCRKVKSIEIKSNTIDWPSQPPLSLPFPSPSKIKKALEKIMINEKWPSVIVDFQLLIIHPSHLMHQRAKGKRNQIEKPGRKEKRDYLLAVRDPVTSLKNKNRCICMIIKQNAFQIT